MTDKVDEPEPKLDKLCKSFAADGLAPVVNPTTGAVVGVLSWTPSGVVYQNERRLDG